MSVGYLAARCNHDLIWIARFNSHWEAASQSEDSEWDAASAGGQPETGDHYLAGFWDAVSQAGPFGKPHPRIRIQSGMQFPREAR